MKSTGKNVFIYSHGCEMRGLDTRKISSYLKKNNFTLVNDPKDADFIIFMTCAFLNTTARSSLERIKEFQTYDAELIVAGCLPDIQSESLKLIFNGKIIPTKNLDIIDDLFPENQVKFSEIQDEHFVWKTVNPFGVSSTPITLLKQSTIIKKLHLIFQNSILDKLMGNIYPFFYLYQPNHRRFQNPSIYQITISRGCNHNCSYCSITKSVGPLRSKPISQCIKEFNDGLAQGYTSFILQADDIGTYGIDINSSLPELLDTLTQEEGAYGITLRNTHPFWIIQYIDQLEKIIKRGKIKEILLSIQSGSDQILKRMKRGYTKDKLIDATKRIKTAYPQLKLGFEIIIGFPGETRDDFRETMRVMDTIHADNGMIAAFSPIKGTAAYAMEPKVSDTEIRKRMNILKKHLRQNNYFAWYNTSYCKGIFFKEKEV